MTDKAARAHSDLNTFSTIVTILEGGHIYLNESDVAARTIIKLCQKQAGVCLKIYDQAIKEMRR